MMLLGRLGLAIRRTLVETSGWNIALSQTPSGVECHIDFGGKTGA